MTNLAVAITTGLAPASSYACHTRKRGAEDGGGEAGGGRWEWVRTGGGRQDTGSSPGAAGGGWGGLEPGEKCRQTI